jgi:Outer membrane protein beta-barrel domain
MITKKTSLAIMLMIISSASFAQVSVGVKLGLNIASESITLPSGVPAQVSTGSTNNFMAGLVFKTMMTRSVGIQTEFLYSNQGGSISAGGTTETDKFSYLNIPVLLRVQIVPAFHLNAGPQLGFLLSAKEGDASGYTDIKDELKSTDVGLAFGAGFDFPGGVNIGLRYIGGLTNINRDASAGTAKNQVVQFTLGWRISRK